MLKPIWPSASIWLGNSPVLAVWQIFTWRA